MSLKATSDLWWKNAVVYCLDVETFLDCRRRRLRRPARADRAVDYLAGLGVSCLWLMPFYPSPQPRRRLRHHRLLRRRPGARHARRLRRAGPHGRDRGIRVIADFVMNHTSDQHPWFQAARASRDSPYRDFYVWRDEKPRGEARRRRLPRPGELQLGVRPQGRAVLPAPLLLAPARPQPRQPGGARRARAGRWRFWLQQGLSGFRVDAVPFLIEPIGLPSAIATRTSSCATCARYLNRRNGDAVLLGEVNLPPRRRARVPRRRGRRRAAHGARLPRQPGALPRRWRAATAEPLARRAARRSRRCPHDRLAGALRAQPRRADARQALRGASAQEVFARFGPDPDMQLYGRGLRRRLPTMLDGDERGDPHGLLARVLAARHAGAVLRRGDRDGREPRRSRAATSVRTPMQWSAEPNGGFSTRRSGAAAPAAGRRARSGPSASTSPPSGATRTRC